MDRRAISDERKSAFPPPPTDLHHLFPIATQSGWTTTTEDQHGTHPFIRHVPLSDSHLGVHRVLSGTTHEVCTLSDGIAQAWEAVYRKGSYRPSGHIKGGFGFYLKGPGDEWANNLLNSEEVVFGYAVRFQEGFEFVKGGKLPGVFGGEGYKAFSCTGGRQNDRCDCFDLRLMWRANGQGELYAYLPPIESNTRRLLDVPGSHQNPAYGFSVGRGSFKFTPGKWTTVTERVKLNEPGQDNGEVQVWVDGISVISIKGLVLRSTKQAVFQGMHFETFFGGSTSDWASPKEQRAWMANVSGATVA